MLLSNSMKRLNGLHSNRRDLELLSDDEALFEELENEEDNEVAAMRERRIKEIQDE